MGSVATRKKLILFARVRSAPECALSGRVHTQAKLYPPLRSATKTSTGVDIRFAKAITNCSSMYSIYSFGIRRAAKNKGPDNTACDCMGFYCEALRLWSSGFRRCEHLLRPVKPSALFEDALDLNILKIQTHSIEILIQSHLIFEKFFLYTFVTLSGYSWSERDFLEP